MKISRILIFAFFIPIFSLPAQTKEVTGLEELYNAQRYAVVLPLYLEQLKKDPSNSNLNYKIGVCYLNSRSQKNLAVPFLEKAIEYRASFVTGSVPKHSDVPFESLQLLGDAYSLVYKFEAAITSYKKYLEALEINKTKDATIAMAIGRKIDHCQYGIEFRDSTPLPSGFNPEKIKGARTSDDPDPQPCTYSSSLSADKSMMVYTLKMPANKLQTIDDSRYFEQSNIVSKTNAIPVKEIDAGKKPQKRNRPDTVINVTTVGASVDGQIILSYQNDCGDGNLYIARLKGNLWSIPFKPPKSANTKGWEPCETISADGGTLYFVSDRQGGYGGKDIYSCKKLPNGEWSKARNLGPVINSAYDDEAPYIHPDNVTLYFSSNRNKPRLSFDHFTSVLTDSDNWLKPVVVGYPVDRSSSDAFYQVTADIKNDSSLKSPAFTKKELKQRRTDSIRGKLKVENNNFMITFVDQKNVPLTLLRGEVSDVSGKMLREVKISVIDNTVRRPAGIYQSGNTGSYSFVLPSGKNNNITYEADGYLFQSKNINVDKNSDYFDEFVAVKLPPLAKGSEVVLNNVFFDSGLSTISEASNAELNRIRDLLSKNPKMEIQFCGYTFSKDKAGKRLAKKRTEALVNYMVHEGISKTNLSARAKSEKVKEEKGKGKGQTGELQQKFVMEIEKMK